ncbi:MAG: NAD(P)/FAD-dependent oxidoreductase [Burkholderiaceae bacterium]|nr:NAD(P)/FAD-dependent oxidoreductase [Burkholderiaceae bacterium]
METVDCIVIGAGVVGLAVAAEMARRGHETWVLEAEDAIGTGTSSRNSEVIHAGIYYARDSLKARLCVAGRHRLYDYCASRGIAHRRCGKLIVATADDQLGRLDSIVATAAGNGVDDLRRIDRDEALALEPALSCVGAIVSPSTGIVDSHALMLSLQGDLENAGGLLALRAPVERITGRGPSFVVHVGGEEPVSIGSRCVVNSTGLTAPMLARRIEALDPALVPRAYFAKGNYYALQGKSPFSRLIYPVPEQAGLGVHLTVDLGGQARFGPDVEWIDEIDYLVDPRRADAFYAEIRRYWPALRDGSLQPAYAGIRPKIQAPGEAARDFVAQGPDEHGLAGLVNLFGIESPGLTSSLAIGDMVADMLVN